MNPCVSTALHVMVKPVGAVCNLACRYCYFLSKEQLSGQGPHRMNEAMLENYILQLIDACPQDGQVHLSWQGGEPMLRGLDFFRRAVQFAELHRKRHQQIVHTIQTNGTLIDDAWAAFLRKHLFLVGISIDGPESMHDAYRMNPANQGTFDQVMRGWNLLQKHGVQSNVLCTVHAANMNHPLEVYRFFRDELKAQYLQLIPIVERADPATLPLANAGWNGLKGSDRPLYRQQGNGVTERSVTAQAWGQFLIEWFDQWVVRDVGQTFVNLFDVALGNWLGQYSLCMMAPTCGAAPVLDHQGNLYSCDHYVEPDYHLGHIGQASLKTLALSPRQQQFGQSKFDSLPTYCRQCPVLFACYGECPKNRFIQTPDGQEGLNYLCAGYRRFFVHITPAMNKMADLIRVGKSPRQIIPPSRPPAPPPSLSKPLPQAPPFPPFARDMKAAIL